MKNLFVSTTFAKDKSKISDILSFCEKRGLSNLELGSNHCFEKNYLKILKKKKLSYLIHNYFPIPKKSFVVNIASQNKSIRNKSLRHAFKAIRLCKQVEAKLYTIHPGFLEDPTSSNLDKDDYDFIWKKKKNNSNYSKAFMLMIRSLKQIAKYAKKNKVKVAIETEGSINKKNYLIMQKPREYSEFFKYFKPSEVGINLNVGHLNLASKAYNFSKIKFLDLIKNYVTAIEFSHNNGIKDQHLPVKSNTWYWSLFNDKRFKKSFKILEFRNTKIEHIKKIIKKIKQKSK